MAGVPTTSFRTPEVAVLMFVGSRRAAETAASALIASAFQEQKVSNGHHPNNGTHIEDLKNLIQVQFPGGNPLFIFPRVEIAEDRVLFAPLGELPLNICHGAGIARIINDSSRPMSMVRTSNSRRELIYRVVHGPTELVRPLSICHLIEHSADISAERPEFDAIRFFGHRVLAGCEPGANRCRRAGNIP